MLTQAQFNGILPEFKDPESYTPIAFQIWQGLAYRLLNSRRFDSETLDLAAAYIIAHHFALGKRDQDRAARGGAPGEVEGPKTAKAVDKVSASMDVTSIGFENQGFWGATTYGLRLLQLTRTFGAGGVQIGPGCGFGFGFPQGLQ